MFQYCLVSILNLSSHNESLDIKYTDQTIKEETNKANKKPFLLDLPQQMENCQFTRQKEPVMLMLVLLSYFYFYFGVS